jgi:hypothetical protein
VGVKESNLCFNYAVRVRRGSRSSPVVNGHVISPHILRVKAPSAYFTSFAFVQIHQWVNAHSKSQLALSFRWFCFFPYMGSQKRASIPDESFYDVHDILLY